MKHVRNALNYDHRKIPGEIFTLPSDTVPDGTLSIRDIFDRYARGAVLPFLQEIEPDEEEIPDAARLDMEERWQFSEYAKEEIQNIRSPKKSKDEKGTKTDEETKDVSGEQQGEV